MNSKRSFNSIDDLLSSVEGSPLSSSGGQFIIPEEASTTFYLVLRLKFSVDHISGEVYLSKVKAFQQSFLSEQIIKHFLEIPLLGFNMQFELPNRLNPYIAQFCIISHCNKEVTINNIRMNHELSFKIENHPTSIITSGTDCSIYLFQDDFLNVTDIIDPLSYAAFPNNDIKMSYIVNQRLNYAHFTTLNTKIEKLEFIYSNFNGFFHLFDNNLQIEKTTFYKQYDTASSNDPNLNLRFKLRRMTGTSSDSDFVAVFSSEIVDSGNKEGLCRYESYCLLNTNPTSNYYLFSAGDTNSTSFSYKINSELVDCVGTCSKFIKQNVQRFQVISQQQFRIFSTELDNLSISILERQENQSKNKTFDIETSFSQKDKSFFVKVNNFEKFHEIAGFEVKYYIRIQYSDYELESNLPDENNDYPAESGAVHVKPDSKVDHIFATIYAFDTKTFSMQVYNHQFTKIRPGQPDKAKQNDNRKMLWYLLVVTGVVIVVGSAVLLSIKLLKLPKKQQLLLP